MERVKFSLEFIFRASPTILYTFLTSPACLVRWFCDEVDINSDAQGDTYAFFWSGSEEVAQVLEDIEDERIRFKWLEAENEDE
ncbi:START-like domain-containing protein, partial [Arthrospira platensis SPKY1]|nr:START-like domain-containing protein [Arthrospira platensis SPKY1]